MVSTTRIHIYNKSNSSNNNNSSSISGSSRVYSTSTSTSNKNVNSKSWSQSSVPQSQSSSSSVVAFPFSTSAGMTGLASSSMSSFSTSPTASSSTPSSPSSGARGVGGGGPSHSRLAISTPTMLGASALSSSSSSTGNNNNNNNSATTRVWIAQEAIEELEEHQYHHPYASKRSSSFNNNNNINNNNINSSFTSVGSTSSTTSNGSTTNATNTTTNNTKLRSFNSNNHSSSFSSLKRQSGGGSGSAGFGGGSGGGFNNNNNSSQNSTADSESCDGNSHSSHGRHWTWGWKAGYLLDHHPDDAAAHSSGGSSIVVRLLEERAPDGSQTNATTTPTILRLGPTALKEGKVVLCNEYPIDPKTNMIQPPNDLITLTHLHEPTVVECLQYRYAADQIYTNTGPVLLALNPFQPVRGLYGESTMKRYWERAEQQLHHLLHQSKKTKADNNTSSSSSSSSAAEELPPHVYAIADESFRNMMRTLEDHLDQEEQQLLHLEKTHPNNDDDDDNNTSADLGTTHNPLSTANNKNKANQSILVSGESGSGKTVTTKFVMKYLAALSQRSVVLQQPEKRAYMKVAELAKNNSNNNSNKNESTSPKHHRTTSTSSSSSSSSSLPFARRNSLSGASINSNNKTYQPQQSTASKKFGNGRHSFGGVASNYYSNSSTNSTPFNAGSFRGGAAITGRGEGGVARARGGAVNYDDTDGFDSITMFASTSSTTDGSNNSSIIASGCGSTSNIEAQVLQSNPILESFGNARTVRNDNSSRFGKFIEIQFTRNGKLVGAQIETYLLEKVRLVSQNSGERNYHIFYELLSGASLDAKELKAYHLTRQSRPQDFKITCSGTYDRRDGVSDHDTYRQLRVALDTMKLEKHEISNIFSLVSAILHASNLTFVEDTTANNNQNNSSSSNKFLQQQRQFEQQQQSQEAAATTSNNHGDESAALNLNNPHLPAVCTLLGVQPEQLNQALCSFTIQAGRDNFVKRSLNRQKAEKGLEALLKATYGALFSYLVNRINDSIAYNKQSTSNEDANQQPTLTARPAATIGVLDIFGFESFTTNSFEQLCINFCNEALQQQFNAFVLKNEQAEYEREGIEWSFIEFPENQDVLDLIEKRGTGILSILDDQCKAPGPSDKAFALDMYNKCSGMSRFVASRKQTATLKFSIRHYAGPVEYTTTGFTEKNRDELPKEACELLRYSSNPFIQKLADIMEQSHQHAQPSAENGITPSNNNGKRRGAVVTSSKMLFRADSSVGRATVGGQFRRQLRNLRNKIDLTTPHYIRCLKPNDLLVPDHFDPAIVAEQLRCGGILEAVRVARAGFTQHYTHADFVRRYRTLAWRELSRKEYGSSSSNNNNNNNNHYANQQRNVKTTPSPSTSPRGFRQSSYMQNLQNNKGSSSKPQMMKPELSPAEMAVLCKDLIRVLYRKIYLLAKEDGHEIEGAPSPCESPSPMAVAKAKTYSFTSSTLPSWSKASSSDKAPSSGTTTAPSPAAARAPTPSVLPPAKSSSGSVKSRYTPWDKNAQTFKKLEVITTISTPHQQQQQSNSNWKRGGLTSSDYAKVGIQMGKTKVFLRHKAFEALERIRSREQTRAATRLNSIFRMYLNRLAYIPYRDAFRRELCEHRKMFESQFNQEEFKESKEGDYADSCDRYFDESSFTDVDAFNRFRTAAMSFHRGGQFSADSLVDKWLASKVKEAIHNPVPRHEWGKHGPSNDEMFKWVLSEGIWVKNYSF